MRVPEYSCLSLEGSPANEERSKVGEASHGLHTGLEPFGVPVDGVGFAAERATD